MLKRKLGAHLRHGSVLRRHLVQRRMVARNVQATTPLPFLRTIGLMATPPGISVPQPANRERSSLAAPEENLVEPILPTEILAEQRADQLQALPHCDSPPERLQSPIDLSTSVGDEKAQDPETALADLGSHRIENSNRVPALQQPAKPAKMHFSETELSRTVEPTASIAESPAVRLPEGHDPGHNRVTDGETGSPAAPAETWVEAANKDASAYATGIENAPPLAMIPISASTAESAPKTSAKRALLERVAELMSGEKKVSADPKLPRALQGKPGNSEPGSRGSVLPAEPVAVQAAAEAEVHANDQSPKATAVTAAVPKSARRAQIDEAPKSKAAPGNSKKIAISRTRTAKPSGAPWSWTNQPEAPAASREAADLFEPRTDTDRSAASWRERLVEAIKVETDLQTSTITTNQKAPGAPAVEADPSRPVPAPGAVRSEKPAARRLLAKPTRMSETARRFLAPLVGFNPREVSVAQGPAVSRVLAAANADAIAQGDSILLGPGQNESDPKALGLLAHELTHLARGRDPSFVPPVVSRGPRGKKEVSPRNVGAKQLRYALPATVDEEQLARRVEGAVQTAAKGIGIAESSLHPISAESRAHSPSLTTSSREVPVNHQGSNEVSKDPWRGLPAPWEPMPEWVHAPETPDQASQPDLDTGAVSPPSTALSPSLPSTSAPGPARADVERSLPEETPADEPRESAHKHKKVTPDLDALAKQVYTIMRQRLAADRRREFMY